MVQRENCLVCQIAGSKIPSKKVYEDEQTVAVLDVNGANPGHCFIFPKNHYPIIEQVPDDEIGKMFQLSNKISAAIFEALKCQGTNIFVANGTSAGQTAAHFMINIIPRNQNDGINLQWQSKHLDEEEISTVELKLKEEIQKIGTVQYNDASKKIKKEKSESENGDARFSSREKASILRQMTRMP